MLKIKSLEFSYSRRLIFSELNFSVEAGKVMHLQGANGLGKSTLISLLAGLQTPSKGSISYESGSLKVYENLQSVSSYLSAEANGLYLKMDATDNLLFWPKLHGIHYKKNEIIETLCAWGLGHPLLRENFPVGQFSTGMRRRLGLARLALSKAPIWLLDEPIYGLDEKGINLFKQSLKKHLGAGGLAVVVSHDVSALSGLPLDIFSLSSHKNSLV